jgi:hypothetical protein
MSAADGMVMLAEEALVQRAAAFRYRPSMVVVSETDRVAVTVMRSSSGADGSVL